MDASTQNPKMPLNPRSWGLSVLPWFGGCIRQVTLHRAWLLVVGWLFLAPSARALSITNVSVANVTPSSFTVVWASAPPVTPSISVFADAGGVTNLAGLVELEFYPLHTGSPVATNAYDRRLNQASTRQKSMNDGVVEVRVSDLLPRTTYYYSLSVTNNSGQSARYPANGQLAAVTTATENSFVVQSRQLLITLPGLDVSGSIVTLQNSNTPSLLAAVAGDGASSNQVVFSLTDLLTSLGNTNELPLGNQEYTLRILGTASNAVSQSYSVIFTSDFLVGQAQQFSLGQFTELSLASDIVQPGQVGSLPISLYAGGVTNLSFALTLPTNRFSILTLQGLVPQLGVASMVPIGSNRLQLTFSASPGQSLQGNQQIAQLNYTIVPGQSSGFIPFRPESSQARSVDGSLVNGLVVVPGRLVIVGSQPLLESSIASGSERNLAIYGHPGSSYEIDYSTNLANPAGWKLLTYVPLTNTLQVLTGLDQARPVMFLRALQFTSTNSFVDAAGNPLVVYGTPGSAYTVQYSTNLTGTTNWQFFTRVPLTNAFAFLPPNPGAPNAIYRSLPLATDPPVLDAIPNPNSRSLIVYGAAGTNYTLQYSTNLSGVVTWQPLLSYRLTNSFQYINNLGNTNPQIYYRVKR